MQEQRVQQVAYICLVLWILGILILYLSINSANVDYCLRTYGILLNHKYTLLLVSIPSLILVSIATSIYLRRFFSSKKN